MLERINIENTYNVDITGVIQTYGMFYRQPVYAPYFWEHVLEGSANCIVWLEGVAWFCFAIQPHEYAMFPEIRNQKLVYLREYGGEVKVRGVPAYET